jgi:hypothetical protein
MAQEETLTFRRKVKSKVVILRGKLCRLNVNIAFGISARNAC